MRLSAVLIIYICGFDGMISEEDLFSKRFAVLNMPNACAYSKKGCHLNYLCGYGAPTMPFGSEGEFMSKLLGVFFLSLISISCSQSLSKNSLKQNANQDSIIGGAPARNVDAVTKSTVALVVSQFGRTFPFCTGTLIAPDLVVTAAHCVYGKQTFPQIYFGENMSDQTPSEALLQVEGVVVNPEFTKYFAQGRNFDVALIKLKFSAPAGTVPVAILADANLMKVGEQILLSGYGIVNDQTNQRAKGLNQVYVPIAKLTENFVVTDQTQLKGACRGDSGGPAFLETADGLVVVGATRGPHGDAVDCQSYGEYTDLSKHIDFIKSAATELKAQQPVFTSKR